MNHFYHLQNSAFNLVKLNDLTTYKQATEQTLSQFVMIQYLFSIKTCKSPTQK